MDYSWRVWATDVADCYPFPEPLLFSNCAIFHIAKPAPTAGEGPQTLPRFGGNIGLMAMIFQFVPDANHYQFEVNAGDIQDEAAIGALLGTFDFTADQIASYDATIAQQGLALPVPWHIVLINHVQPAQAYQWRVAACADSTCSEWSAYNHFAEYLPWPFSERLAVIGAVIRQPLRVELCRPISPWLAPAGSAPRLG